MEVTQMDMKITDPSLMSIDLWMISRLQRHISRATEFMNKLMVRKAINSALFLLDQDFQWYMRRTVGEKKIPERKTAINNVWHRILEVKVRLLAPIIPHICEEIWEKMGKEGFISLASWPIFDEAKVDIKTEEIEALIKDLLEDTSNIKKATGIIPNKICYYTAMPWKWKVYLNSLEKSVITRVTFQDLITDLLEISDLKEMPERVAKFLHQIIDEINQMPSAKKHIRAILMTIDEFSILNEVKDFLEKEFNINIEIYQEEDPTRYDPRKRAQLARPYRPAIYIE
jgi:leucyl-tRNA synthetase